MTKLSIDFLISPASSLGDWGEEAEVDVGINVDGVEDTEPSLDLDWADNGRSGQQEDIGCDVGIDNSTNIYVDISINVSIDIGLSVDKGIVGVVSVDDSELVAEGV